MEWFDITVRSVTFGQRGQKALQKNGLDCFLHRTPRWMESKGCGYAMRVRDYAAALKILNAAGIPWQKVYRKVGENRAEEVVL